MVFSEFRRRFDVLAPHLTKKLGRNYIVKDEKRVSGERDKVLRAFGGNETKPGAHLSHLCYRNREIKLS